MTDRPPVFIQVEFSEDLHARIRKWIQRHPDLNGKIYSKHPYYIAQFQIHPNDVNNLAKVYHYLRYLKVQVYHLKHQDPKRIIRKILDNYWICSYRPFEIRERSTWMKPDSSSPSLLELSRETGQLTDIEGEVSTTETAVPVGSQKCPNNRDTTRIQKDPLENLSRKINNMDHDLEGDKLEGFIEATERILDFIDEMEMMNDETTI